MIVLARPMCARELEGDPVRDHDPKRRLRLTADSAERVLATAADSSTTHRSNPDRAAAVAHVAALISSGAGDSAYRRCIQSAVATGATPDELISLLRAVARTAGMASVVAATPALAFALGYDIDAEIEQPPRFEAQRAVPQEPHSESLGTQD
jgi:alkylhydroperoxidase/carboxymuconolactone decarboxylase family protein YurZ